jgi:glycogen synthase
MHVLVTSDTLSGVWGYTRELVTGLVNKDIHVTLVSMGEIPAGEQTEWMDGLRNLDFRPVAFRAEWMRDAESDLRACEDFLQAVIADTRPDVLHLNQFYFGSLPTELPKIVTAHSDVLSWWQCVHPSSPKQDDGWITWYRKMVARGIQGATALVAPSQWLLGAIKELYAEPRLSSVIYPGSSPTRFNPHMSKEMIAVSSGRIWDIGKNSALLAQFESPIPLYLVGPDAEPGHPSNQKVFPPRQRLHVKGLQNEKQLRILYGKSAIYVATSQYEPFGMSTLEAALSRCAIVASDIPTHREIWGESACYFRNNDPEALQQVITELSNDRELCTTYGKLAYDHARSRYAASRMVDDYRHLYQAVFAAGAMAA